MVSSAKHRLGVDWLSGCIDLFCDVWAQHRMAKLGVGYVKLVTVTVQQCIASQGQREDC